MQNHLIQIPETTLPNGLIVPAFKTMQYLASRGPADLPVPTPEAAPWVDISYHKAIDATARAGYKLLTESQHLAIAWDASQQDINWTGGKVGEGVLYAGLHKGTVHSAQPGSYESPDAEERRWLQLSNSERIYDLAGNAFSWIFDDIQGDHQGLTTVIEAESPSLTTAPYPKLTKGMGWRPEKRSDWTGSALVRGGCWYSGSSAGAFYLNRGWPDNRLDGVGFRCTQP